MLVVLDTGVLGNVLNPNARSDDVKAQIAWAAKLVVRDDVDVYVPGIADYELRRELTRMKKSDSLQKLDDARTAMEFVAVEQSDLDRAAQIWALKRATDQPSGSDAEIDADAILCAQANRLAERTGDTVVVATTNVRHFEGYVDARLPHDIA